VCKYTKFYKSTTKLIIFFLFEKKKSKKKDPKGLYYNKFYCRKKIKNFILLFICLDLTAQVVGLQSLVAALLNYLTKYP
jgi:hypothetical protein